VIPSSAEGEKERRPYRGDQIVVAIPVARLTGSRRSRSAGIPRRSCYGRLRDPVVDASVVLKEKKRCNHVREPCVSKREQTVQSRGRDEVGAHCRSAAFPSGDGGTAVSGCGSLAAL
jgi:hypothetical protein